MGCLLSISIECIQLFMANRCSDIDDVILNTLGAWVGYLV
ncbi:VanZ family protein [Terrilactibacillus laevilacticus]|uniref:VanZ family protein n=1 Tax=Terrilactibacillus laevilacticus TaxID=1380157 RepID=A0ABW5PUP6_9BACI